MIEDSNFVTAIRNDDYSRIKFLQSHVGLTMLKDLSTGILTHDFLPKYLLCATFKDIISSF